MEDWIEGVGTTVGVGVAVSVATGVCVRTGFVIGTLGGGLSEPELEHAAPVKRTMRAARRRSGLLQNAQRLSAVVIADLNPKHHRDTGPAIVLRMSRQLVITLGTVALVGGMLIAVMPWL